MTELDRMQIVENLFPDWREHLSDGKIIDQILDGLTCQKIVFNRCSRPGCNHAARRGRKTCIECAAKAAQYMRSYGRRRSGNTRRAASQEPAFDQNLDSGLNAQLAI